MSVDDLSNEQVAKKKTEYQNGTLFFFLLFPPARLSPPSPLVNSRVACRLSGAKEVVLAVLASGGR